MGVRFLAVILACACAQVVGVAGAASAGASATFGKTSVGASVEWFAANRKRVNQYPLPAAGSVSELRLYLAPTPNAGQQVLEGVLYADSGGAPGVLLGATAQLTFTNTSAAGWYHLSFPSAVKLSPGRYWIGVLTGASADVGGYRYDAVTGARDYNANTYASGPSNPFGSVTKDNQQMSLYALYTPTTPPTKPVNTSPPTISGAARQGAQLKASTGTWSGGPTSYAYAWERCDALGGKCVGIPGASSSTHTVESADVKSTLRVSVTAANAAGSSAPAISAQTAVVTGAPSIEHLEYVFVDGTITVYDADKGWRLVKTINLPQTNEGVRGATVSPGTHRLFISYGGDGVGFNGSVLAYDLLKNTIVWTVHLGTGIDSGQVSPDGKRLYMPTGENTPSGIWNILDTSDGALIGKIQGGSGAHNTVVSNDGRYVYLGGRDYNYLDVYDTTTGKVRGIGPLVNTVRPFTIDSKRMLAYTTATHFDGFQVSNITTGKVLFTISFGSVPPGFPFTGPSHGASLSPDGNQLYVIDTVHREVHAYDVSRVSEGVAPKQLAAIPVAGLTGTETPCAYDCGRGGWVQHSYDGRYVYVGDSGAVIETAGRKVVANIPALLNTKKSLEIDWSGGVPIATSGRTGVSR
ncbi:MAG TPA: hypothetical protein VGX16_03670 [Solirubrobacteraceae bacterium]|jgi:hypothetical protein|nr:hypothetical protein [Solirubrobacteraceae bacterium]